MVISENKEREHLMPGYSLKKPNSNVLRPQPLLWYTLHSAPLLKKSPDGERTGITNTNHSAFQPVTAEKYDCERQQSPSALSQSSEADTQVTWCYPSDIGYRCKISVAGIEERLGANSRQLWNPSYEDISRDSKGTEDEDEGEIDVGDSYETDVSSHVTIDEEEEEGDLRSDEEPQQSSCGTKTRCTTIENASPNFGISRGSIINFSARKGVIQNNYAFEETNLICKRPYYFSDSESPPLKKIRNSDGGYVKDSRFSDNESPEREESGTAGCWLPFRNKFLSGDFDTTSKLAENDNFIKGGNFGKERLNFKSISSSSNDNVEDLRSSIATTSPDRDQCSLNEEQEQIHKNTGFCSEENVLNLAIKDTTRDCSSVKKETAISTFDIRTPPRDTSTPVKTNENRCSVLFESKGCDVRENEYDNSKSEKCTELNDQESLCKQIKSSFPVEFKVNKTQFIEKSCSNQTSELSGNSIQIQDYECFENLSTSTTKNHIKSSDQKKFEAKIEGKHFIVDDKASIIHEQHLECNDDSSKKNSSLTNHKESNDYRCLRDEDSLLRSSSVSSHIQVEKQTQDQRILSKEGSLLKNHTQIKDLQHIKDENDCKKLTDKQVLKTENYFQRQSSLQKAVSDPHLKERDFPLQRNSVLVETRNLSPKNGENIEQEVNIKSEVKVPATPLFSPEDVVLRSRVLVLLWVLLGERRLREVGYPVEPVHRILWRAVDVCCSVAGVKSAAAVPLNADHDCGSDMLCFRDHTHRFLEVCAPTREHWKQFGWASLTVDAVVRKIYEEELVPLLRLQVLPPDIHRAALHLSQLDRTPLILQTATSPDRTLESDSDAVKPQPTVIMPIKKKRGRPAKISHKVDEGGRIERVMLWRFLLNLLEDPRNSPCIHWVQRDEGIFRIINTDWLARLWGRRHGNPRMTYEKMARAMRTYYRSKVLQPVPRHRNLPRKLVYKFNPAVIHKVAAMKLSSSTFSGRGLNYNTTSNK